MRPLTRDEYLLIAVVVAVAFAGICAFLVALYKVLEEIRDSRQRNQRPAARVSPARLPERARSAYRVSVIRH